ncbi:dnaJ homolog subfamily C member 1 [Lates japonicus]|uniref:DnaJ homolog subfamily C member 1 n=1 Tax=Lates japonicus TaxID=270547 RepID=A0AAD3M7M4_LATJO|nr:dnaJ homolog subfamily C member 1 [Lates japonicus]
MIQPPPPSRGLGPADAWLQDRRAARKKWAIRGVGGHVEEEQEEEEEAALAVLSWRTRKSSVAWYAADGEVVPGKSKEECMIRYKMLAELVQKRKQAKS